MLEAPAPRRSDRRSTTSKDVQGSSEDRRRRKRWLVTGHWRSDVDVLRIYDKRIDYTLELTWPAGTGPGSWDEFVTDPEERHLVEMVYWALRDAGLGPEDFKVQPTCRCFHCGKLLTEDEVSPDRIVPGCEGGTYRRENLRPACLEHNVKRGSRLGHARKAAKK